ncbi:MAG: arylsulfotransferase family protein [Sandaracinaceae bacterium]
MRRRPGTACTSAIALAVALVACGQAEPDPVDELAPVEPTPVVETDPEPELERAQAIPEETAAMLEAIGYVDRAATDNPDVRGVTENEGASRGLNLFSSRDRAIAHLTDLEGEVVHTWQTSGAGRAWMHIEPLPDGSVLAITKDRDVARHAWDSSLIWRTPVRAHHDLAVRGDGSLLVLTRRPDQIELNGTTTPVLTDDIVELSADGERGAVHPLLPLFQDDLSSYRRGRIAALFESGGRAQVLRAGGVGDVLHTNSIAILDHDLDGVAPAGSLLLSFRATSRIAIVDAAVERVLWSWGRGELQGQHDATQLDNGNILLFDNGNRRNASRALEVDPRTDEIVWRYEAEDLYSMLRGGAQRLDNGNVLITEADAGHALEVTREGTRVWEFWNPDVRPREGGGSERAVLYRLNRFPRTLFAPLAAE